MTLLFGIDGRVQLCLIFLGGVKRGVGENLKDCARVVGGRRNLPMRFPVGETNVVRGGVVEELC